MISVLVDNWTADVSFISSDYSSNPVKKSLSGRESFESFCLVEQNFCLRSCNAVTFEHFDAILILHPAIVYKGNDFCPNIPST